MKRLSYRPALAALCLGSAAILAAATPAQAAQAASDSGQTSASTHDLYLMLIRQARQDGHARAALAFLDDFERHYPGELEASVLRINCLLDLGQVDAAQDLAANLPKRKEDGAIHAIRGHVRSAQGLWEQAIAEYNAALVTKPSDALINNALGYAQLRAGQMPAAIEALKRARELAPQDPVIRNNLLLALIMSGRRQEADATFARIGRGTGTAYLRQQVEAEATRLATPPQTVSIQSVSGGSTLP